MNIDSIIQDSEIQYIVEETYGRNHEDTTFIGNAEVTEVVIVKCMNLWCKRVEKLLRKIEFLSDKQSKQYRYVLSQRGFTFSEYLRLFDSHIKEDDYGFHPILKFLKIQTDTQRRYYTSIYENNPKAYVQLLQKNRT